MGPSPTCHPPKGEECETSVEHGLPLWAEPAVGYCSRRLRPSPMWGSRFVGALAVGPWVGEQKPLGKTPLGGNPSPKMTYLPTSPWQGHAGRPPGRVLVCLTFPVAFLSFLFVRPPPGSGCPCFGCLFLFFVCVCSFPFPPSPLPRPRCLWLFVLPGPGCPGLWCSSCAPTPPFFWFVFSLFFFLGFVLLSRVPCPLAPCGPALARCGVPLSPALALCWFPLPADPFFCFFWFCLFWFPPFFPAPTSPWRPVFPCFFFGFLLFSPRAHPLHGPLFCCLRCPGHWRLMVAPPPTLPPPPSFSLAPLSAPPLSRVFPCFRLWVPWASALCLCPPQASPVCGLACGVCAVCWGCAPHPPRRLLVFCCVSCLVLWCRGLLWAVSCGLWGFAVFFGAAWGWCRAVWCVVVLCCWLWRLRSPVGPASPFSLLASCGALLCRAVFCVVFCRAWCRRALLFGVLCCVLSWCAVSSRRQVRRVVWGFFRSPPPLLLPPVEVAWSPALARCCILSWGAVLCWSVVPPILSVCCCSGCFLLVLPCCYVLAGWCCVLLPVVAGCSLLGLGVRCCFALACFGAGAPAWLRGSLPCRVLWFVVAPRSPVLCSVASGFSDSWLSVIASSVPSVVSPGPLCWRSTEPADWA